MGKKLPDHVLGLIKYLSSPNEKANEDLILAYFRKSFGDEFTRQKEASSSDGYIKGHFVVELKGKTNDWLAGLFQGMAYSRSLDFSVVVVAAKGFLALWTIDVLDENLLEEARSHTGAPNATGKKLAQKYKDKKSKFLKQAAYLFPTEYLEGIFQGSNEVILKEISIFEKSLRAKRKVRQKITTKNFTIVLKQMIEFFETDKPIKAVRAFYSMLFGWTEFSQLTISEKHPSHATLGGETIENLIPGKREKFRKFVKSHYIHLEERENIDDFFAMYDVALDSVDRNFRKKNGIFFTDLNLSRFAMWFVRNELGDIGKDYLVIDPACGSGNLVTNWRSPMELRHKVVSEIEPELLYTVEQRMKGDKWHNGKYTVVPKVSENIGLNFLDKSAEDYLSILKKYLSEKGHKPNKPLAFLCNPPYRSDDDQGADSVSYSIDQSILDVVGPDAGAERTCCFLAQMKRISEIAESSGLPNDSLLLLFTGTSWLSQRPVYQKIRKEIFGNFEDVAGMLVTSNEFFEVSGKFPIAFTIWKYKGTEANLKAERPIDLVDLTFLKKSQLSEIDWTDETKLNKSCNDIIKGNDLAAARLGANIPNIKDWSGLKRFDFQREKRKNEKSDPNFQCGLPKGDSRHSRKKTLGENNGEYIGFLDDLTPCRTKNPLSNGVWFYLDNRFMRVRTNRCFSGAPDSRGHFISNLEEAKKGFTWYAITRTFADFGYPIWANASELWPIMPPPSLQERLNQFSFAITFAENECVETIFPANNPLRGSKEISIENPMSPLNPSSFWNTHLSSRFGKNQSRNEEKLVVATNAVFLVWKKRISKNKEIYTDYKRPYFIGESKLSLGAGLIQIRDYAKENDDSELKEALDNLSHCLAETKKEFHHLLNSKSGFNYFEIDEKKLRDSIVSTKTETAEVTKRGFDHTVQLRLSLACKIVSEMSSTKEFSRVKFTKAFYLSDMMSGIDLKTEYTREAAGPLDQRSLYNDKIGIEPLAAKLGFFATEKKRGKDFDFVQYKEGKELSKGTAKFEKLFGKNAKEIENVIKLTAPMTRDQIEIVATLYACWNDLLLAGKKITDQTLIKEFRSNWHPEKAKKFLGQGNKKPRFTEEKLISAISWMKSKGLSPKGSGRKTKSKESKNEVIPF